MTETDHRHILIRAADKTLAMIAHYERLARNWRRKATRENDPVLEANADVLDHCAGDLRYSFQKMTAKLPPEDCAEIQRVFQARPQNDAN